MCSQKYKIIDDITINTTKNLINRLYYHVCIFIRNLRSVFTNSLKYFDFFFFYEKNEQLVFITLN